MAEGAQRPTSFIPVPATRTFSATSSSWRPTRARWLRSRLSLQTQIDEAQAETARLQAEFDKELEIANAEAAAAGVQEANNAYTVTATQTEATGAQTTEVIKKKKKPNSTLKIGAGGVAQQAGSGLNIGV